MPRLHLLYHLRTRLHNRDLSICPDTLNVLRCSTKGGLHCLANPYYLCEHGLQGFSVPQQGAARCIQCFFSQCWKGHAIIETCMQTALSEQAC